MSVNVHTLTYVSRGAPSLLMSPLASYTARTHTHTHVTLLDSVRVWLFAHHE